MSMLSNTPRVIKLDKMLDISNIMDMLETANTTAGEVAIRYLEALAKASDATQEALANRLGVCRQTIAKRFKDRQMDIDFYVALANAVGVDPADTLAKAIQITREEQE